MWGAAEPEKEEQRMPKVMEYEELKDGLPKVLILYSANTELSPFVVTVFLRVVFLLYVFAVQQSQTPGLYCEVKGYLFADESSDWEDA